MRLDEKAKGAIMMCLQKSLLEQSDIVPMLDELDFTLSEGMLTVMEAPQIELSEAAEPVLQKAFKMLSVEEVTTEK